MTTTPPAGWPTISSSLCYADPKKAIDWLCAAFGFQVRLKVEEGGKIVHSELTYGNGVIMVGSGDGKPELAYYLSPRAIGGKNTQNLLVYVDDLDAHHARAVAGGAKITKPIALHDYGAEYWADRSYGCEDCEGHNWWFSMRVRG